MDDERRKVLERVEEIFFGYATDRRKPLLDGSLRLAHYTTAENARKIIQSKEFWLRNTTCMSDFSEVEHGYKQLLGYFNAGTNRGDFCAALDAVSDGIGTRVLKQFDEWWNRVGKHTY